MCLCIYKKQILYFNLPKHTLTVTVPCLQDNTMDFIEYVAALNLVLRGKLEDKLRWSFKVFDNDDNGRLDKDELRKIVKVKRLYFIITMAALWCSG